MNIGDVFGKWTVIDMPPTGRFVVCKCECNTEKKISKYHLLSNNSKSCKRCSLKSRKTWIFFNLNNKFGFLTIIGKSENPIMALCKCDCGVIKEFRIFYLKNGTSGSCGCNRYIKQKNTNIEKYGFPSALSNPDVVNKRTNTIIERYGVDNISKLEHIKEKKKKTCLLNYGVDNPQKSEKISRKTEITNIERYGAKSPLMADEIKNKIKKTNTQRYNNECVLKNKDVREKIKKTNIQKYGNVCSLWGPDISKEIWERKIKKKFQSKGEAHLRSWIEDTFGIIASKSYCGGASPCEIDIHIPEKGISIEYNGDYWHCEKYTPNDYHLEKTQKVREQKKTQLIHIFESEWNKYPQRVKAFLSGKLTKGTPIRASKCDIREVPVREMRDFCEYHLQGPPQSSVVNLGLYHNNELLALATISKPHRQNMGSEYHLSRFITKPGYRVHGGLSKLSQEIYKRFGKFITYVHLRLSDGKSYEKSGYKIINILRPDYWYFDSKTGIVISKQSRMKKKVNTPEGMTEHEHALSEGLFRVYDCGKLKFIYEGK